MRSFRDEICAVCRGRRYPRQCRNSLPWREHKARAFDDIGHPDFDCPFGIPLNSLHQGSAEIGDAGDPRATPSGPRPSGAPVPTPRTPSAVSACIFARRSRTCSRKVECHRHDGVVRSVARSVCARCGERVERLRVSVVITAHNEGDEVRKTVESLIESVTVGAVREVQPPGRPPLLEVVVVDDGSTDGSCTEESVGALREAPLQNVAIRIVRHDEPWGVGRSRNHGAEAATGHVICFHDAHMRFPEGALETLALKALASDPPATPAGAVICSASAGLHHDKPRWWGCDLFWNVKDGLQPKWRMRPPEHEWGRVPCPMGAGYVLSRGLAERLTAATGGLWEDTAGRWGFSEQALAVKAFLMDIPVLVSRDIHVGHLYRDRNPIPDATREVWRNVCRATAVLLPEREFRQRFATWCERRLGRQEFERIVGLARAADPARPWVRDPNEVFTHLCGRNSTVTERHPNHAWLPEVAGACRGGSRSSRAWPRGTAPTRVLCWRPGESTLLVRRMLPDAEIRAIEHPGHRAANWADVCALLDIRLEQVEAKDFADGPALWTERDHKGYDLVLVNGPLQEECAAVAQRLLAPGGTILTNPTADRDQIEQAELAKERRLLENHEETRAHPEGAKGDARRSASRVPAALASPSSELLLTVLLLNWRRPQNLTPMLDCLARQTVPLQVFLWNNGDPLQFSTDGDNAQVAIAEHPLVRLAVRSSRNMRCWPRWLLASMAETEFVCSMDDDLLLADERVLEDAIEACRSKCPDGVVGFFGWRQLAEGKGNKDTQDMQDVNGKPGRGRHPVHPCSKPLRYKHPRQHVNGSDSDLWVDFIKGRFMLLRRRSLERVPLAHPVFRDVESLIRRADDFYVNLCVSRGRRGAHLVPGTLSRRWKELPQRHTSLAGEAGHYRERDELIRRMFAFYERGTPS